MPIDAITSESVKGICEDIVRLNQEFSKASDPVEKFERGCCFILTWDLLLQAAFRFFKDNSYHKPIEYLRQFLAEYQPSWTMPWLLAMFNQKDLFKQRMSRRRPRRGPGARRFSRYGRASAATKKCDADPAAGVGRKRPHRVRRGRATARTRSVFEYAMALGRPDRPSHHASDDQRDEQEERGGMLEVDHGVPWEATRGGRLLGTAKSLCDPFPRVFGRREEGAASRRPIRKTRKIAGRQQVEQARGVHSAW